MNFSTQTSDLLQEALACLSQDEAAHAKASAIVAANASPPSEIGKGHIPNHHGHLDSAISALDGQKFTRLKAAIQAEKAHLNWQIDEGKYYASGADVGDGYRSGNMHTLLIGPKNALVPSDDFLLGLFLLAPWTLYRDHRHKAPEIYVPLTGPSGWRIGDDNWQDHAAGSFIVNAPDVIHATRVYETPFLALFAWTEDIQSICSVVPRDDWQDLEKNLHAKTTLL